MIGGKTRVLGVIGHPVDHSLSPLMHNAAIARLNVDFVYLPFPVAPESLAVALAGFAAMGVVGFSVTIPHKQAILPMLMEVSSVAAAVGAVNTVLRKDGGWLGTNTDVEGFVAPLLGERDWSRTVAVILGNGGAARAVVAGCSQLGYAEIYVVGRNREKLAAFREGWDRPVVDQLRVCTWDELSSLIPQATLLVNATDVGMGKKVDQSPISVEEMRLLSDGAVVYDLIYNPSPTKFLQLATDCGLMAIDGAEMLVQQGAAALKLWLQLPSVPVDVMRQALQSHLG
ncbi:MAG: shikimate dehydrogenase [Nostocaceae cyanobacterium]|nr:shikimate dehydrogenase [Nostocaceae cyanobacterium]